MDNKRELRRILAAIKDKAWERQPKAGYLNRALNSLSNPPAVGVLNALTVLGLVIGLLAYWSDLSSQREARTFNAWQLLAMKQAGGFGRREAIEFLNVQDCFGGGAGQLTDLLYQTAGADYTPRCWLGWDGSELLTDSTGNQIGLSGLKLTDDPGQVGVQLPYLRFVRGRISASELAFTNLGDSVLDGSYLYNVNLSYSNFAYASMRNMYNQITRFDCATFLGVQTRGSSFVSSSFENITGQYAVFDSTFFEGASFKDAGLQGSSFDEASLQSTSFEGARLSDASLRNTTFFEKVSFARADLEGATIVSGSDEYAHLSDEGRAEFFAAELDFTDAFVGGATISIQNEHVSAKFDGAWTCEGQKANVTINGKVAPIAVKPCGQETPKSAQPHNQCDQGNAVLPHRDY
ncbi:pentapeptide repeat-containing protein [Agrobacterium sp. B1(2019)]|uniref:pentapeptide repeat-containing protein n=1 Tax=Agrobacterium sp. B1(2019) TaxID=2607032 RepID=UPI0011EE6D42|nr:pentapeptide repeat-containing protein [Agrobacterium sp. B1(2019)]TZG36626.1 pentapeptide repeat-containing protein [Agrobacterium sp. B1(2019)]